MGRQTSQHADNAVCTVLGDRIRRLRKARGLTLEKLGESVGLSHAFLSQVERGVAWPSLGTLTRIASALGIGTAALLTQHSSGTARLVRGSTAPVVPFDAFAKTITVRALTGGDALMKVTESTGQFEISEQMAHPGEEVVYVLEGALEMTVAGQAYELRAGDVLSFDCSLGHTYRALGDVAPRFLVIAIDPGAYASPIDESALEQRRDTTVPLEL